MLNESETDCERVIDGSFERVTVPLAEGLSEVVADLVIVIERDSVGIDVKDSLVVPVGVKLSEISSENEADDDTVTVELFDFDCDGVMLTDSVALAA